MRKILYYILLTGMACGAFQACNTGGNYDASPSSNGNSSINPLNPLTAAQFTWTGTSPVSGNINGSPFVADTAYYAFIDTTGFNYIYAKIGSKYLFLDLFEVYPGTIYNMGYHQYDILGTWVDSLGYQSALGNSGELDMITNDSVTFSGRFYFQGVNSYGAIINITNGYFNLSKN